MHNQELTAAIPSATASPSGVLGGVTGNKSPLGKEVAAFPSLPESLEPIIDDDDEVDDVSTLA